MIKKIKGFTLIELLIVIAILGVLAFLITPNLLTSLKKGRDARRKEDLANIQKAVEMYYEDKRVYPPVDKLVFASKLCENYPCLGTDKVYIERLPQDPSLLSGYGYNYCVSLDGQKYQLYAALENSLDPQIITPVTLTNCQSSFCGTTKPCSYGISSPNTTP